MGKKNRKEKGKGKEKSDQKAEKKAEKRFKKELAEKGEEDIEKLIAEFQEQDRRRVEVFEEKCPPPTPRCSTSLVAHPDRDELLMFGGEYFTGNKMFVYNDLFVFQIKKREWLKVSIPNPPPPRSAHQAVTVSQRGGQMWVFGGEFSSHSQAQFYHYKDLWVLHLKEKRWEQIKAPGGPTARSGHRMVALKKKLFVYGGFHDNTRDYKYYSDLYIFNTETFTWSSVVPSGTAPSPRSGCVMFAMPESSKILIYGGYSKEKLKKDIDVGKTFTDMFTLSQEKKKESSTEEKWKWQPIKQSGLRPTQRSGMTGVSAPGNKAFLFGGVFDEEEDDEDMDSMFFKELWALDLDKSKWFQGQLRGKKSAGTEKKKKRRKEKDEGKTGEESEEEEEEDEEEEGEGEGMEVAQDALENLELNKEDNSASCSSDGVFTVTQSAMPVSADGVDQDGHSKTSAAGMDVDLFWPSSRMNTALAVRDGVLYMYGGMIEDGDKQVTLGDFYGLDINKMDEWSVIIAENRKQQEWNEDDSSDEEGEDGAKASKKRAHEEDEDDDDDDDDSDESMEITFDDAPARGEGEGIVDYFDRSQAYWVEKAQSFYEEEGETAVNKRRLVRFAKELCEEACER